MAHIGYVRVNPDDRRLERQLDGIVLDAIFEDKAGCDQTKRPALTKCFASLREGDVLHVHSLDRLAGNMRDLQKLVADCAGKGVEIRFHKEDSVFFSFGKTQPDFLLHLLGVFADYERALVRERQMEGFAAARKKGTVLGRPHSITPEKEDAIRAKLKTGQSAADVALEFGIGRSSVYNIRRKMLNAGK
jgi:DNA invertase Pin-like site-specific DNA recombinase